MSVVGIKDLSYIPPGLLKALSDLPIVPLGKGEHGGPGVQGFYFAAGAADHDLTVAKLLRFDPPRLGWSADARDIAGDRRGGSTTLLFRVRDDS